MIEAFLYINIAQTLFAAIIILTKRPLNSSDKILSIWLLFILLLMAKKIAFHDFDIITKEWISGRLLKLTYPIFLYLYLKYLISSHVRFQPIHLLHFLLFLIFFSVPICSRFMEITSVESLRWYNYLLSAAYYSTFTIYGFLIVKMLKKYSLKKGDYYSYHNSKVDLKWFKFLVTVFYIYFISLFINNIVDYFFDIRLITNSIKVPTYTLIIYVISFRGYQQKKLHTELQTSDKKSDTYQSSGLTDNQIDQIQTKLLTFMEEDKPWLNPELTVGELSSEIKIPKHHITQILNQSLQKNFYTLVNEFRSQEVIRIFHLKDSNEWKLEFIAYKAGFNSRSSFNNFFKKHTGKTPSEYRREIQK